MVRGRWGHCGEECLLDGPAEDYYSYQEEEVEESEVGGDGLDGGGDSDSGSGGDVGKDFESGGGGKVVQEVGGRRDGAERKKEEEAKEEEGDAEEVETFVESAESSTSTASKAEEEDATAAASAVRGDVVPGTDSCAIEGRQPTHYFVTSPGGEDASPFEFPYAALVR